MTTDDVKINQNADTDGTGFILGVDLGDAASAIAYYDVNRRSPEIIDLSGGYGKPAMPTVTQYIPETGEWVFGEYAVLNRGGRETTLASLPDKLGKDAFIDVAGKTADIPWLLSLYIKELVGNCKNIDPKAKIDGIAVSVPEFLSEKALSDLKKAFALAGYEDDIVGYVPEKDCLLTRYLSDGPGADERVVILDYGSREMRGGVYDIGQTGGGAVIKTMALLHDDRLGAARLDESVNKFFTSLYESGCPDKKISRAAESALSSFTYQHKDLLFQKNILKRPVKLYYNFTYPPLQKSVDRYAASKLSYPFERDFDAFIRTLLSKNLADMGEAIGAQSIGAVILCGGGFGMLWAKEAVMRAFPGARIVMNKNAKCAAAEGASLVAAIRLGAVKTRGVSVEDKLKLKYDFGVVIKKDKTDKYLPVVEKNAYWWQDRFSVDFLVNEAVDGDVDMDIYRRDGNNFGLLQTLRLKGLPGRPKGATRLNMAVEFINFDTFNIKFKDLGFGSLYPASRYKQDFTVALND